jgi:hypothetical protein
VPGEIRHKHIAVVEELQCAVWRDCKGTAEKRKLMLGHLNTNFRPVGLVPVNKAAGNVSVVVPLDSLPHFECEVHGRGSMRALTVNGTGRLFIRCYNHIDGKMQNGYKKTCGANIYPEYDGKKLNLEIIDDDDNNEPLLFHDGKVQEKIDNCFKECN